MAVEKDEQTVWLAVIGKSLAYLCLNQAEKTDAKRVSGVINKVKFLKDLGVPQADAAFAAGSSPASVSELMRVAGKKKKGGASGTAKKRR